MNSRRRVYSSLLSVPFRTIGGSHPPTPMNFRDPQLAEFPQANQDVCRRSWGNGASLSWTLHELGVGGRPPSCAEHSAGTDSSASDCASGQDGCVLCLELGVCAVEEIRRYISTLSAVYRQRIVV